VTADGYARLFTAATGRAVTASFFNTMGERIWNQVRLFNLREGFDARDDRLPRRFVEEPLADGPHKGRRISERDMEFTLKDYYQVRGWDDNGQPTTGKLRELGLDRPSAYDFLKEIQ
jgi:aldehyde:ferredoxin oxidoreductase